MAIDSVVAVKGATPSYYETGAGAHYYAYSPAGTTYSEAFANIVLPTRFQNVPNTGSPLNYTRNGYIALGIKGTYGIDLGLRRDVTANWHPCYYDVKGHVFRNFPDYAAPSSATNAIIVVKPIDTTHVGMYIQFQNASGVNVGTPFDQTIEVASGNLTLSGGKVSCSYYRFASLVPEGDNDNQMDSTYMLGGKFINLGLYNRNTQSYDTWGISTARVTRAHKVSPERITLSYTTTSDTFGIDHWFG